MVCGSSNRFLLTIRISSCRLDQFIYGWTDAYRQDLLFLMTLTFHWTKDEPRFWLNRHTIIAYNVSQKGLNNKHTMVIQSPCISANTGTSSDIRSTWSETNRKLDLYAPKMSWNVSWHWQIMQLFHVFLLLTKTCACPLLQILPNLKDLSIQVFGNPCIPVNPSCHKCTEM